MKGSIVEEKNFDKVTNRTPYNMIMSCGLWIANMNYKL